MSVQKLLIAIIVLSFVALTSQRFLIEQRSGGIMRPKALVSRSQDRCYTCGCKGGPGWRVRLTGQCAYWKTLKQQCGNPPSNLWCSKES
jgi:hypothetical protein